MFCRYNEQWLLLNCRICQAWKRFTDNKKRNLYLSLFLASTPPHLHMEHRHTLPGNM